MIKRGNHFNGSHVGNVRVSSMNVRSGGTQKRRGTAKLYRLHTLRWVNVAQASAQVCRLSALLLFDVSPDMSSGLRM